MIERKDKCPPFMHVYIRAHGVPGSSRLYKTCARCGYSRKA